MTPEERQLIGGLFDRMRGYRLPEKDSEAEALINERARGVPDAAYMLVQSVLIQEQALQEADKRIKALEEQARTLETGVPERTATSGSFLGGLFGGGRAVSEPPRGGSVPQIGSRAAPSAYDAQRPWMPPQGAQQAAPAPQAAPGGGGFLRTAMATAAGVAGGVLVAGAIRDMMGGNSAQANAAGANAPAAANQTQDAASASETAQPQATQDVSDDGGGWLGGGDSGDFEI